MTLESLPSTHSRSETTPGAPQVEIRIADLGPLEIQLPASRVQLPSRTGAVLEALVAGGRSGCDLEHIAQAVWEDERPHTAIGAIRTDISRIRRLLDVEVTLRASTYVLEAGSGTIGVDSWSAGPVVDAARFDLESGNVERCLNQIIPLLHARRGAPWPLLCRVPWVHGRTVRLDEVLSIADETAIEAAVLCGMPAAVAMASEAVASRPTRERRWALLMWALYRDQQRSAALGAFGRARSALIDHAGIEPGPLLRRLEQMLISDDTRLTSPQPLRFIADHGPADRQARTAALPRLPASAW